MATFLTEDLLWQLFLLLGKISLQLACVDEHYSEELIVMIFFPLTFGIFMIDILQKGEDAFYCVSSLSSATMRVGNCLRFLTASKMKFSIFARVPAHMIPSPIFFLSQVIYYFSTRHDRTKSDIKLYAIIMLN